MTGGKALITGGEGIARVPAREGCEAATCARLGSIGVPVDNAAPPPAA